MLEASCERHGKAALPERAEDVAQSSSIALAYTSNLTLAYVADADSRSVHTLTLASDSKELGRTRIHGSPRQLLVLPDGRVAVTLSDRSRLAVLEPASDPALPMVALCERALPSEPWAMARTPSDDKLIVTSAWGASLSVLDAKTLTTTRTIHVARDPRSVVVDEKDTAFVSHSVGASLSVVDLDRNEEPQRVSLSVRKVTPLIQNVDKDFVRSGSHGFALARVEGRLFVPMTSVDPGSFGDTVRESKTYYGPPFDGVPKQAPIVGVVDINERKALVTDLLGTTKDAYARECLLPRAVVARGDSLYVACQGIDSVLELDARAADPGRAEKRRFAVAVDPQGLAIDERDSRLIVFSQLGAAVTVIPLSEGSAFKVVALDYHPPPELARAARGRQLFYRTDDTRISDDGLACASCHIDGRDDGLTWTTPLGPRQTPMLVGRLASAAPYGWEGDRPTLADYIKNTVINLGGHDLGQHAVDDLAAYLLVAPAPPHDAQRPDAVSRGAEVFASTGCSSCHSSGSTDHVTHQMSATSNDLLGAQGTDTPSLQLVSGTAPYFHDGRYATLEALLADPDNKMGPSSKLSSADRDALVTYLRSL